MNENWLIRDHVCQLLNGMIVGKSFFYTAGGNSNNEDTFGKVHLWVACSEKKSRTWRWLQEPKSKSNLHGSNTSVRQGKREREEAEVWFIAVSRDKDSGHQGDIINKIKPFHSVELLLAILFSTV